MARMIWKGAISFGLVHVPVQLFPATRTVKPSFRLLDKRSMDPVGYRQVNKRTGKDVSREDIVRGYEYEKERYVVLTDDEIRAANPESTQTVDILTFVDQTAVSFLYLDTPYYLVPDRNGEKVYALLRDALKDSGRIGIALVVMRDRQHLGALIPVGPLLALDTLRWQDELRPLDELSSPAADAKRAGVSARELEMAKKLIDDMSGEWTPDEYHDTFRDDILELVERKVREGRIEEIDEQPAGTARAATNVLDLTELLKRSLRGGGGARGAGRRDADDADTADHADGDAPRTGARRRSGASARRKSTAKTAAEPAAKGATKTAAKRAAAKKPAARRKHAA
ncbi:non-homologous end joining protein Ku [Burkholderia pseudomultivorans]|uniref:Non-homologous end joining protein Ku n=1 Tax=Burkholderia pseudomultivorans TaxID=1207504 RepID=A0ABU2E2N4_9BURK|nr:Ku protein [Burkholderia pseudomultivorans]MDR8727490.1 Non-homologous end joining protein Ku [Burkholderia pseudomultivorans]MDR8736640.1 Non-homologous end joining protein Ku [Burkholderia pseudomultivorans]MDR8740436.1 Non-homologous end joining protein Ku [Burkholderia pseudomultivorans]MDR8754115.1 Non-homologous end joining protein Ku [Burkholderia pseudomultivorans]MDR8776850.1 Non-homologous end joining protein Ku [Burkholderia pseudomultivorans]